MMGLMIVLALDHRDLIPGRDFVICCAGGGAFGIHMSGRYHGGTGENQRHEDAEPEVKTPVHDRDIVRDCHVLCAALRPTPTIEARAFLHRSQSFMSVIDALPMIIE